MAMGKLYVFPSFNSDDIFWKRKTIFLPLARLLAAVVIAMIIVGAGIIYKRGWL